MDTINLGPHGESTFAGAVDALPPLMSAEALENAHPALTIEKRVKDGVEYTFVLADHAVEHAPEIAHAVKDCDALIIEAPGAKDQDDRQQAMRNLTRLASSSIDPALRAQIVSLSPHSIPYALVGELPAADKPIITIDIDKSDPRYPVIDAFTSAIEEASISGYVVAPPDRMRDDVLKMTEASVAADAVRDEVMAEQLTAVHKYMAENMPPGSTAAVVTGRAHYGVLEQAGFSTKEQAAVTRQRIFDQASLSLQAHIKLSEGTRPDDNLLDRISLGLYVNQITGERERGDMLARKLTDAELTRVMQDMDALRYTHPEMEDRRAAAADYLDMLCKFHLTEQGAPVNVHVV